MQLLARQLPIALHAANDVETSVQIDDVAAARGLVQTVDILSHQQRDTVFPLELRERVMRIVRLRQAAGSCKSNSFVTTRTGRRGTHVQRPTATRTSTQPTTLSSMCRPALIAVEY